MYQSVVLGCVNISVPLLEGMALAGRHGFQGIELPPDLAAEVGLEKVQEEMKRQGLKNGGFILPQAYASPDEGEFRQGAETLKRQAEISAKLGGKGCCIWIIPSHDTMSYQERFEFLSERLRVYANILKDNGISLGLEFIGPQKARVGKPFAFVHTLPQMLELCKAIGTGNCGLLLDAHHCYTAGHDMSIVGTLKKEDIVLVHVNDAVPGYALADQPDSPRCLPGESGIIDLKTFMSKLQEIGYDGPVAPEPFSEKLKEIGDPDKILDTVKQAMDAIWPSR